MFSPAKHLRIAAYVAAAALVPLAGMAATPHLDSIAIGTSKDMANQTRTFGAQDTIYANVRAGGISDKATVVWHLLCKNVEGQPPNAVIRQLDQSFDVPADASVDVNYSAPTKGWPKGTYTIEADLMQGDQQIDVKTADFTVQ